MKIYKKLEIALNSVDNYLHSTGILLGQADATKLYLAVISEPFLTRKVKDENDFYSQEVTFMGKKVYRAKEPLNEILLIKKL